MLPPLSVRFLAEIVDKKVTWASTQIVNNPQQIKHKQHQKGETSRNRKQQRDISATPEKSATAVK